MSEKYSNPPIVEALCEFYFEEDDNWDAAIPGLVYNHISEEFPIREQTSKPRSIEIDTEGKPNVKIARRLLFFREDRKALIQIAPHFLGVNVLKPYPSWVDFLPLIIKGYTAYKNESASSKIQRIGLRYVNQFKIPAEAEIEENFEFRIHLGKNLPKELGSFLAGSIFHYEDDRDRLKIQLSATDKKETGSRLLNLDLVYWTNNLEAEVSVETVKEWLETAHFHLENVFEACLSVDFKKTFI